MKRLPVWLLLVLFTLACNADAVPTESPIIVPSAVATFPALLPVPTQSALSLPSAVPTFPAPLAVPPSTVTPHQGEGIALANYLRLSTGLYAEWAAALGPVLAVVRQAERYPDIRSHEHFQQDARLVLDKFQLAADKLDSIGTESEATGALDDLNKELARRSRRYVDSIRSFLRNRDRETLGRDSDQQLNVLLNVLCDASTEAGHLAADGGLQDEVMWVCPRSPSNQNE